MKTSSTHSIWLIRWLCLVVALVALTGCATTGSTYHATVTATNEAAIVSGTLKPFLILRNLRKAALQGVDGVSVGFWQAQSTRPILIDPGSRALSVHGQYVRFFSHGDAYAEVTATLQAGHAYQIKVELQKQNMTFWVEDLATHETVSNRQTSKASWIINLGSI